MLQFWEGVNIYDEMRFPNPPIFPITIYPLTTLPPVTGALAWFTIKVALTAASIWLCFLMVRPTGERTLPPGSRGRPPPQFAGRSSAISITAITT